MTVQRNTPGAARSIDLLEHAVRFAEEFMGERFPNRLAGVLSKKAAQSSEGAAARTSATFSLRCPSTTWMMTAGMQISRHTFWRMR